MRISPVSDGLRGSGRRSSAHPARCADLGHLDRDALRLDVQLAAAERHGFELERAVDGKRAAVGETAHAVERHELAVEDDRSRQFRQDQARLGIAISAPSRVMRPSSSGFANVPAMRVLTSALPSNATALVKAERTRRSTSPFTEKSGILGRQADGAAKGQRVLGDEPRDIGDRDVAFRELDA